ncbi:MAG: hypothetical protein P8M22_04730 [Phycisphaerales bacterium]|nr:hypothetical protein [Phycisphaerales bacterium]
MPISIILVSGIGVRWVKPSDRMTAIMFFFAAGVLIAALCTEVIPQSMTRQRTPAFVIGFTVGVVLMLLIRSLFSPPQEKIANPNRTITLGSILNIGISLMINGVLVGIAFGVPDASGLVMIFTLSVKATLIGSGLAQVLFRNGRPMMTVMIMLITFSAVAYGGAVIGWLLVVKNAEIITAFACATAAAIMLWVVFEELMVEAHERGSRRSDSLSFFVGCGAAIWLSMQLVDAVGQ